MGELSIGEVARTVIKVYSQGAIEDPSQSQLSQSKNRITKRTSWEKSGPMKG